VCVGSALAGLRPIGEMQFNDFVATGFNQLVNNAAKIRYAGARACRWSCACPGRPAPRRPVSQPEHRRLVLPHAGSQDRRALDALRRARALRRGGRRPRSGPVLRAHRALPQPKIRQALGAEAPAPPRARARRAAPARRGSRIVSYGRVRASVSRGRRAPGSGRHRGLGARPAQPGPARSGDRARRRAHCGKVLVAHEDSRTGGIGESLARSSRKKRSSTSTRRSASWAPSTPRPYSPPLEDAFLAGEERIERAARLLAAY